MIERVYRYKKSRSGLSLILETYCDFKKNVKIGAGACRLTCKHFLDHDEELQIVRCDDASEVK
jgi:hypothetical protein